jgi:hypothetical protein
MAEGRVFVSYSHQDAKYRDALRSAAKRLEDAQLISFWHDEQVAPGAPWAEDIRRNLESARLVLALVSPDFLASSWCMSELGRAYELRDRRLLDVVPIIVRQCDWRETPLGAIQALPSGGAPVETSPNQAAAFDEVVAGLERLLRGDCMQPAFPSRADLIQRCADKLESDRRLMLLAPWREGLEEMAKEIACRTHGDAITNLSVPAVEVMTPADFYAELSRDPSVTTMLDFRRWLVHKSTVRGPASRHLALLLYFGGPHDLVRELGHVLRGVFDENRNFSFLVFGQARCATFLSNVKDYSLFTGIMTEHVPGLDLDETRTLLQRLGADPVHAAAVHKATGGHPEWTALVAPEVRAGRIQGLDRFLSQKALKPYQLLQMRLRQLESGLKESNHAGTVLEKLLRRERVVSLSDACDDFAHPEVRLYYDGMVVERDEETVFRCEAVRLAAQLAVKAWRQAP